MSTGVAQSPNFQWEVQKKDTSAESLVSNLFRLLHPRIAVNLTVKEKEMSILGGLQIRACVANFQKREQEWNETTWWEYTHAR